MISKLTIQNVALIEYAEIDFSAGLNVLSGETGAGKSVILDSVNFVLGAKADKSMIRYGESQCSVFAEFDISKNRLVKEVLVDLDILPEDDILIVSRKYTLEGKSSIRVNGIPLNAATLRRITSCLVDVHGQSEHFYLLKESNQLKTLDNIVGSPLIAKKKVLSDLLKELRKYKERLSVLGTDDARRNRRMDVLLFQIEEITKADLKDGEEEELVAKRNKMNSVEKILLNMREAEEALRADGGALDGIRTARRAFNSIFELDAEYGALSERLENSISELEDIAETIDSFSDELYYDENELEKTERRLDEIKLLKRKYGDTIEKISDFLAQAQVEYDLLANSGEEAEKIHQTIFALQEKIYAVCLEITDMRKKAADGFCRRVIEELKTLNIPSAQFVTQFNEYTKEDCARATSEGADNICFLFSANAGEPVKPLSKIISGGEMSRFMLAIKTQLSEVNDISTYIFDEIDAGISGQTAKIVGEKFADIAKNTQIIAVSHLAQIACIADREFLIRKQETNGKTTTNVTQLDETGRLAETIRLLGGDEKSEFAAKHAKEMMKNALNYKKIHS